LTPSQLLQRRVKVSEQLKILENERLAIDAELISLFSDRELRNGIEALGGWILHQRQRSSWAYATDTKKQIRNIQSLAQLTGSAHKIQTTYLALTQAVA
jgi:hypothetical protein